MPLVTVIVPSFNRSTDLRHTIGQLLRQEFADFDLWVIDQSDGADRASNEAFLAETTDPRVRYLHLPTKGLPNARNEGLKRAAGEIVIFVDDDVLLLSDRFIRAHVDAYADPRVGGVTGRHVERYMRENSRGTACHVSLGGRTIFNLSGRERQAIGSCKGSNMSFRMEAIRQVGGFDRRTHMLEDTDFSVRIGQAGWALSFEPDAELVHLGTKSGGVREQTGLTTECRRFRSTAYFVRKHRGTFGVACFLATFGVIGALRVRRFGWAETVPALVKAVRQGFAEARLGPDQSLEPA